MQGIDISNYQSGIDLASVPCDFVIIKATQGVDYVNPDCDRAYQQAKACGKLLGIYHYVDGSGVDAEADFFVNNCRNYFGEAIIILDWEQSQNKEWRNDDYVKELLRAVKARTGVAPLIYMSKSVVQSGDWSDVANEFGLWFAQYADMNPTGYQDNPWTDGNGTGAWSVVAMQQYSSCGQLPGYNGNLDLNIAYMDANGWRAYAGNGAQPTPAPQPTPQPEPDIDDLARRTIRGEFGNGAERRERLGDLYDRVQARVNELM